MRRYQVEALPLGKEAVGRALTDAGLAAGELGLFAVCSCTGYATPGLDILLARDLGMAPDVQRLFVGHMGCYAALPGLGTAADFVVARGRPGAAALRRADQPAPAAAGAARGHPADRLARALLGRGGRRRAHSRRPNAPGGVRGARGRRGHRHLHGRPHDLGGHRPRLPDGAVTAGAGTCSRCTSARLVDDLLGRHGLADRRRGRLGGAPGRPQDPRRGAGAARARRRRRWPRPGRCSPRTGTAPRRPSCWCWTRCAAARRRRAASCMLAFGPGLTLYGTLLEATTVAA